MIEPVAFGVPVTFDQPAFPGRACQGRTLYSKNKVKFKQPIELAYVVRKPSICSNEACEAVVCMVVLEGEKRAYFEQCHVQTGLPVRITFKPGAPNKVTFTIGTRVSEEMTEKMTSDEDVTLNESRTKRLFARLKHSKV